jgi:hypothetical protein
LLKCLIKQGLKSLAEPNALAYIGCNVSDEEKSFFDCHQAAGVGRQGVGDLPLDFGHLFVRQSVAFPVVELKTLFGGEPAIATLHLATKTEINNF